MLYFLVPLFATLLSFPLLEYFKIKYIRFPPPLPAGETIDTVRYKIAARGRFFRIWLVGWGFLLVTLTIATRIVTLLVPVIDYTIYGQMFSLGQITWVTLGLHLIVGTGGLLAAKLYFKKKGVSLEQI